MDIDSIDRHQKDRPDDRNEKLSAAKLHVSQYIVALVLLVLGAWLWRLQILGEANYRVLAEQNRIRKVPVLAPRGRLFDRYGHILVDNYPSVTCYLLREQQKGLQADLPLIATGLHLPVAQIQATIKHFQYAPAYQPIPLKTDITPDEQAFIAAHRDDLPELQTMEEQRRLYPRDGFAANLIGYVGEVSEADLNNSKYAWYSPGDVVGKSGVEEAYDEVLRGTDGSRDMIVNSHGKEVGVLGEELAVPGKDLRLTIDLDVQMAAEKALEGKDGAIVAMDPHTGEILAMVSRPSFDPNQFAVRLTRAYWQSIVNDPEHPMLNKAIQAQQAPGSTFKIIMSLAGLEQNVAQTMHVECNGGADFYGHYFKCDQRHGMVNINNAIPLSCDTFYYTLANKLGIDTIARYAQSVGIGEKTGIDLPDEAAGIMPSTLWKLRTQHDKWYAGETISVGIGQGAIEATPLQLARAIGGIASGGVFVRPHVVFPDELNPQQLADIRSAYPGSGDKKIPFTAANWEIITDGMAAVTEPGGTAAAAHLDNIDFAGKTGTAQLMSSDAVKREGGGHKTEPNAWFVGIAPRRNPDIVVAVLWENGNWGWNSGKLAAQVINAFVTEQRARAGNLLQAAQTTTPTAQPSPPTAQPAPQTAQPAPQPTAPDKTPAGAGGSAPAGQ
jgi:penicillin-binding protein 2